MKTETITVKNKKGEEKSGDVLIPENISELNQVVPADMLFRAGLSAYMAKTKRAILNGGKMRRKLLTLDLNTLKPGVVEFLTDQGLIKQQ